MSVSSATASRLKSVAESGQQIWLDNLSRELVSSGELARLIADDGIQGAVANATTGLAELRQACDLFGETHSARGTGFVSVPLPLHLAHDAEAMIAAARTLWAAIGRPNALVAIPATAAGAAALEQAVFEGIGVNATLVFNTRQLAAVRAAHRRGLARRLEAGLSVQRIASVASISISRIDAAVDALLPPSAAALRGKAGVSLACTAYRNWLDDSKFAIFAAFGATPQRLLWAGAQELVGAGAVNAMPVNMLDRLRADGIARAAPDEKIDDAQAVLAQLGRYGIDLDTIGNDLQRAGLTQFEPAHADLLA
ncbi:MAG: transaldolase family protein [Telluria sp.]